MSRRRRVLAYSVAAELTAAATGWTAINPGQSPSLMAVVIALLATYTAAFAAFAGWEAAKL